MKLSGLKDHGTQAEIVVSYGGRTIGLFAFEDAWLRVWPDEDGYHLCPVEPGDDVHSWLDKEYPGHEVLVNTLEDDPVVGVPDQPVAHGL
jgi:hypothetical protein